MSFSWQKKIFMLSLASSTVFFQPVAAEGWRDSWRSLVAATRQRIVSVVPPLQRNHGLMTSLSLILMSMAIMEIPRIAGAVEIFSNNPQSEEFKEFLAEFDMADSWAQQCHMVGTLCCQSFKDISSELIGCIPLENIPEFYESLGIDISDLDASSMCETYCKSIQEFFWVMLAHSEELGIWLDR